MIGLDHTYQLGSLVTQIAEEKAGIMKTGVPVISVEQKPEVKAVLTKVASATKAPIKFTGDDIDFSYRFEDDRKKAT